jgi:trimethylamine corrinoid protein
MDKKDLLEAMSRSITDGEITEAERLATLAVESKMDLNDVIDMGFVPGIQKTGDLWEKGEYFLPELISSAECMKAAMRILQPALNRLQLKIQSKGKIIIGTIEGDIHDIGKNLVASMLSANGFDVIDIGADVKLDAFIQKAEQEKADFICLSSLLTTTMLGQKRFMTRLKEKNLSSKYKVLVGGAPVTQKWADEIGADGYAENALTAVKLALDLAGK